ncbi:MAG: flagellar hook protein FlgE [Gallionella sp.]|nr:flagellar hook protein FlgE [Gallionella sp.]
MSFQQGLSGLNTAAKQLDVIGNNVANASTVGFKQSQAQFADMYAASLAGGSGMAVGTGVKLAAVAQQFSQGNITNTNNSMDTAISGAGFFQLADQSGAILYSRNGQFQVDKDGYVVNNQGHQLQGYQATAGVVTAVQGPLRIDPAPLSPKQTSNMNSIDGVPIGVGVNVDSREAFPLGITQATVTGIAVPGLTITAGLNDTLTGTVDDFPAAAPPVVGATFSVTIPPGTYTTTAALAAAVQTAVNSSTAGADVSLTGTGRSVTVSADASGFLVMKSNSGGLGASALTVAGNAVDGAASPNNLFGGDPLAVPSTIPAPVDGAGVFSLNAPDSYNRSTSLTVYDSKGTQHIASLYFQKAASNTWNVYLAIDSTSVPATGTPMATLNFSTSGVLTSATPYTTPLDPLDPLATAPLTDSTQGNTATSIIADPTYTPLGALAMPLAFEFSQSTQYGGAFGVNSLTQDGYTSGELSGFSTSPDGVLVGRYTNGQTQSLGQFGLVNFTNPQGLQPVGNNEWVETYQAGKIPLNRPGSSGLGLLQSSAVEESNVDLTAELVNMITAQRVYQANAQTIKTQDAVLQTLVNLR